MTHTDLTETLAALVRDFLDPDPCQLDHHGYCQAHSWLCEGRCPHARAREVLAEPAAALPAPVDRAAVLREADWIVEHCPDHGCVEPETDGCHCEIAERLRRMAAADAQPEPTDQAAAIASCPGYETSPNPCRCPCYGCKHHCGAHNPEDVAPPTDHTTPSHRAGLREQIAAEIWAQYPDAEPSPAGLVMANPHALAAVTLAVLYREWPWLRAEAEDAGTAVQPAPTDRAAVLHEEADRIDATRADFPIAVQNGITWATAEMRRHAAEAQPDPGARHVHITIHHPDPTTANTAALCIADLIHGEYSDSLRLTITTDVPGAEAAPSRPADETPDTLAAWLYQRFMVQGVGWDDLDEGDRPYWEHHARAVRRAVARGGFKQPAAGARQDGEQP